MKLRNWFERFCSNLRIPVYMTPVEHWIKTNGQWIRMSAWKEFDDFR